jgi:hypothetical protein
MGRMNHMEPMQLQPRKRRLTAAEKRLLSARARQLRTRAAAGPRRILLLSGAVVGLLWMLTLLASDAAWWAITVFWVVVGSAFTFWMWRDAQRDAVHIRAQAQQLESAKTRDEAEVFDFTARAYAEFEEVEDEGACYAFDLDGDAVAFVVGQEFYPAARFPSLDFSLVYPLDEAGHSVDMLIEKRGPTATPARVIPGAVKSKLEIPEHLAVVRGGLERIEEALPRVG